MMKEYNDARYASRRGRGLSLLFLPMMVAGLLMLCFPSAEAENLLINGSFEALDSNGVPEGWTEDAYVRDAGYTVFSVTEEDAADGNRAVSIRNIGENDARYAQTVAVEPESLYCFSGYIKTETVEGGRGANLSVEGLYAFSESLYDTETEWQRIEWYGETGEDQYSVTLFVRLGGYSGESTGQAWFDDLRLEKVQIVPGEEIASRWYKQQSIGVYDEEEEEEESSASAAWPRLIMLSLLYSVIAILAMQGVRRKAARGDFDGRTSLLGGNSLFYGGLLLALVLRVVLSFFVQGYMVDVNCFLSWGSTMASVGPVQFYPATSFCDYPPAYTYMLGLCSLISQAVPGIGDGMTRVVFRFFPALCDVLACLVLDRFLHRNKPDLRPETRRTGLLLLAFHPVTVLNSACWGQMDSVLSLLLLLVACLAIEGKWHLAFPCYMLAVLVKPQALMLGFLGLMAAIFVWVREKESHRSMIRGLLGAAAVLLVIVVPFSLRQDPFWIISQYQETLSSYPYATVNTANFYYLFDGNWDKIANPSVPGACLALAVLTAAYGRYLFSRGRKAWQLPWIEPALAWCFSLFFAGCAFLRPAWTVMGTGAMAFAFLVVLGLFIRKGDIRFLPMMGGLLFLILYVFGIKMHERYIFPAFLLLALAYGLQRDRRIGYVLLGITVTVFLNEGIVLDNSIRLGSSMGHLNADTHVLALILSALNCGITIYAAVLSVNMALGSEKQSPARHLIRSWTDDNRLHWHRADTLVVSALLAVYSVLSLGTLGSTKAPQTAWTSTAYPESVVLDLGQERDNFVMLYFARVSKYDFSVAVSRDGETWDDETWAQMDQGQCWKWKYVTDSTESDTGSRTYSSGRHWFSGRYVRLTAHQINLALCEVLFRDGNGQILPVASVSRQDGDDTSPLYSDPACLIDEQDTFEGLPVYFRSEYTGAGDETDPAVAQPSWWNSTYFDEIYHARTAWEFLTGAAPYETSHPPLGKILISWGVSLFGMTPFGWRFAGAAAGIVMLLGLYLIAKQLTKSTALSGFAAGLMALDCMHLTQTQIATIDSYPVLFIVFAFFFMLRFIQTDFRREKQGRMLTDLGLSGLCMGLAIASKWIGIYAGAGLAVLFFWHGFRVMLMDRNQRLNREAPAENGTSAARIFFRLCLWCLLFFAAIPVMIYLVCYLPYFAYRHFTSLRDYLEAVWNAQTGMLDYHATPGLGMDHPFYSPWYEWPVIGKPMFYATKQYVFAEDISSSIFCIGNPVIWYTAIPALVICCWMWVRNREEGIRDLETGRISPDCDEAFARSGMDTGLVFLLIGFLAQYLPWTLVPRGTYIYHYFASVPFLILGITAVFSQVVLRRKQAGRMLLAAFCVLALGALVLFFPYVTGIYAPVTWLDAGKRFLRIWY